MSTEENERADQRAAWRKALAAAAAARRTERYRRAAPRLRAGMLRKDVTLDRETGDDRPSQQVSEMWPRVVEVANDY